MIITSKPHGETPIWITRPARDLPQPGSFFYRLTLYPDSFIVPWENGDYLYNGITQEGGIYYMTFKWHVWVWNQLSVALPNGNYGALYSQSFGPNNPEPFTTSSWRGIEMEFDRPYNSKNRHYHLQFDAVFV